MKANMANTTIAQLRANLAQGSKLFRDGASTGVQRIRVLITVRDTNLATLDARFLNTTADTAVSIARQMSLQSSSFDIDEFLTRWVQRHQSASNGTDVRVKAILGTDRGETNRDAEDEDEDQPSQSQTQSQARMGELGDWARIGWMAAKHYRRVPGVEFMSVIWRDTCYFNYSHQEWPNRVRHQKAQDHQTLARRGRPGNPS